MSDIRKSVLWPWRIRFIIVAIAILALDVGFSALMWRDMPVEFRSEFLVFEIGVAVFSCLLLFWFYLRLTKDIIMPVLALGRDLEKNMHTGAPIDEGEFKNTLLEPLVRQLTFEEVKTNNAETGGSENWLSELLHVLDQGLIVANLSHEILLINPRAREMFGRQASLALGRNLSGLVDIIIIEHAIARQSAEDATGSERLFCRFLQSDKIMPMRMSLLHSENHELLGYVLAFHDYANTLFQTQELEMSFDALLKDARDFAGEIALLDLANLSSAEAQERFALKLEQHKKDGQAHLGSAWPKGRMTMRALFRILREQELDILWPEEPPERMFMRCDGAAIIELLTHLIHGLSEEGFQLSLNYEIQNEEVKFFIASSKRKIPIGQVETLMRHALSRLPTAPTGDEVLRAHGTEIWPHNEDDRSQLVFILKLVSSATSLTSARPEYYDFEIRPRNADIEKARLSDLAIVVFDSETTGLDPKGGDEVVQLSAVRVKSGKVILSEKFDELVNPGRKIPSASTKIHGITDAMIKEAPPFKTVVQDFHDFCHGEVLLAHNAAFDMAFLRRGADAAGIRFAQPVLDTVYMSAFLFDYTGKHSLDDLARRLDIHIPLEARHTAFGDALVTAEIFVKILPLLEARGVETLGQMLEIGSQMRSIRKQQQAYG